MRYGLYDKDEDGNTVAVEHLTTEDDRNLTCLALKVEPIETEDMDEIFDFIDNYNPSTEGHGAVFVLCDWHNYIGDNPRDPSSLDRQKVLLTNIAKSSVAKTVVMLNPQQWHIPVELEQVIRVVDLPLPDKEDRMNKVRYYVDLFKAKYPEKYAKAAALTDKEVERVSDACAGLTLFQMENIMLMSLATTETFDKKFILAEKREMLKNQGIELIEPNYGFEDIGGLEPVKQWARRHRNRFSQAAFDYGFLRYPRGMFMTGVQGCGKSLVSTALCKEWGLNGIRIKANDLKGSLVGESEQKAANIIKMAEANAPCILVVDEAEKMFAATDASRDGGASQGVLSLFLTFMQESNKGVFVVFTLNNMSVLPRELVDRFEGRFFFDLPSDEERDSILRIHIKRFNRNPEDYDIKKLVSQTDGFNGRGIEAAISDAFGAAFAEEGREPIDGDFTAAFDIMGPSVDQKTIETLREEAKAKSLMTANSVKVTTKIEASTQDFSRV
jgi:AAA+ superfamily predicted ATPase